MSAARCGAVAARSLTANRSAGRLDCRTAMPNPIGGSKVGRGQSVGRVSSHAANACGTPMLPYPSLDAVPGWLSVIPGDGPSPDRVRRSQTSGMTRRGNEASRVHVEDNTSELRRAACLVRDLQPASSGAWGWAIARIDAISMPAGGVGDLDGRRRRIVP
jgi:hypothetical protein